MRPLAAFASRSLPTATFSTRRCGEGTRRNVSDAIDTSSCSHAPSECSILPAMLRSGITCSRPMARMNEATSEKRIVFEQALAAAAPGAACRWAWSSGAISSGSTRVRRMSAISRALLRLLGAHALVLVALGLLLGDHVRLGLGLALDLGALRHVAFDLGLDLGARVLGDRLAGARLDARARFGFLLALAARRRWSPGARAGASRSPRPRSWRVPRPRTWRGARLRRASSTSARPSRRARASACFLRARLGFAHAASSDFGLLAQLRSTPLRPAP